MNIFKRWSLRRQIAKEQDAITHLKRTTPHADHVEIIRHQGNIRRLMEELSGVQANQQQKGAR